MGTDNDKIDEFLENENIITLNVPVLELYWNWAFFLLACKIQKGELIPFLQITLHLFCSRCAVQVINERVFLFLRKILFRTFSPFPSFNIIYNFSNIYSNRITIVSSFNYCISFRNVKFSRAQRCRYSMVQILSSKFGSQFRVTFFFFTTAVETLLEIRSFSHRPFCAPISYPSAIHWLASSNCTPTRVYSRVNGSRFVVEFWPSLAAGCWRALRSYLCLFICVRN